MTLHSSRTIIIFSLCLGAGALTFQDPCQEKHYEDWKKPIPQVLQEHPEIDGHSLTGKCYFNGIYNMWDPSDPSTFDYKQMYYSPRFQFSVPWKLGKGPEVTWYLGDGTELKSHDDGIWGSYPYDDVMCWMLGWMNGQHHNTSFMTNKKAWEEFSRNECNRIAQEENVNPNDITVHQLSTQDSVIADKSECMRQPLESSCDRITRREYVQHVLAKCLLGGEAAAADQIVWCYGRACVNEQGEIKHGTNCEKVQV